MSTPSKIVVELQLLGAEFARALQERIALVHQFNKAAENGSAAINAIAAQGAAIFGLSSLKGFVEQAVHAREEQAKLDASLRSTGQYTPEYRRELAATAEELKKLVGADDDTTISVQRMLISFGTLRQDMPRLTAVVYDMAAALGVDAVTAARQLGMALSGEEVGGAKLRLEIDRTLPKTEQMRQALSQLQSRFSGQALAAFNAGAPALREFGLAASDAKKAIGEMALQIASPFLEFFTRGLQNATAWMSRLNAEFPAVVEQAKNLAQAAGKFAGENIIQLTAFLAVLVAIKGVLPLMLIPLNALNAGFVFLTGRAIGPSIAALQAWTRFVSISNTAGLGLAATLTTLRGVLFSLNGALLLVGAALVGWEIGKFIGNLKVAGIEINVWTQLVWLEIFGTWERVKAYLAGAVEYIQNSIAIGLAKALVTIKEWALSAESILNKIPGVHFDTAGLEKSIADSKTLLAELTKDRKDQLDEAVKNAAENLARQIANLEQTKARLIAEALGQDQKKNSATASAPIESSRLLVNSKEGLKLLEQLNKQYQELFLSERQLLDESYRYTLRTLRQEVKDEEDFNIAKLQLDAVYLEKKKQLEAKAEAERQERQLRSDLQKVAAEQARVQADFTKTDAEKRPELLRLLKQEAELYERQVKALEDKLLLDKTLTEDQRQSIQQRLDSLTQSRDQANINFETANGTPDPNSFRDQFSATFTELRAEMGTFAQSAARTFSTVFNSAISSISNGIMGLINKTMTWKQALLSVASTIVTTLVESLVQYAVKWIAMQVLMAVTGKSIAAASLAANAGLAVAQSAIWAVPATLATISSYGGAAAAAPAQIAIAEAITLAQAAAFADGGMIKGSGGPTEDNIPIWASAGEGVINARAVQHYGGESFVNAINSLQFPISKPAGISLAADAGAGDVLAPAAPNVNVSSQPAPVHVVMVNDMNAVKRYMESHVGEQIIVKHVGKNKTRIGVSS